MVEIIAEHFGMDSQMIKTVEELSELSQVICKIQAEGITIESYQNLVEEIADVEIMLERIKYLHEIPGEEIKEIKKEKIERTIQRYEIEEGH